MKHFTSTFLKGLLTLLPLVLSVYVLLWFVGKLEGWSSSFILIFWPEGFYVPGIGLIVSLVGIYMFGSVIDRPLAKWALGLIDRGFSHLPVIKTVYVAIKDFTDYLRPGSDKKANLVVLVKLPNHDVEIIGLLTRESLRDLPDPITKLNRVAVYIPMSYQFGGYTIFVNRDWITPTNLTVEQAMRSILTAWLPGRDKNVEIYDSQNNQPQN